MFVIPLEDLDVCVFRILILLLLLIDMADLEPYVCLVEGCWRGIDYVFEALNSISKKNVAAWEFRHIHYLQAFLVLLLLLVDDSQAKVDLIGLVKLWGHPHDLRKGFLGVIQGAISVVQDADAIP